MSVNQILYGPPGTGKTFASVDFALEIMGKDVKSMLREEKKKLFADYQKANRIFFTTFHQNMAYEDFIEGIKPLEPQDGDDYLQYEVQDGLFMRACVEASYNYIIRNFPDNTEAELLDFNQLFDLLLEEVASVPNRNFQTRTGATVSVRVTANGNFGIKHLDGERLYTVSRERLSRLFEAYKEPAEISNIQNAFRKVIGGSNATAYWAVLNEIVKLKNNPAVPKEKAKDNSLELSYEDKRQLVRSHLEHIDYSKLVTDQSDPYVFIIDEINRGNVAQIFGELITLIEDDKRLGKLENIRVNLPYSKKLFSVPPNLFIIGTMNTADRSVEALDSALRRRFAFIPKLPEPKELDTTDDGIELGPLLQSINVRLRVLKDDDHTIGHAWLWGISDLKQLQTAFANKIVPLLQEYFYNDDEKLGLVLGDAFFKPHQQISSKLFASFSRGSGLANQYNQVWQYELKSPFDLSIADFQSLYLPVLTETQEND